MAEDRILISQRGLFCYNAIKLLTFLALMGYNEDTSIMEVIIMAYVINDECVACGACAEECPVSAISEGEGKFVIDADTCISCGACNGVCPVGAPNEE